MVASSSFRGLRAAWLLAVVLAGCGGPPESLPPLPALSFQNRGSVARFLEADEIARSDPRSAKSAGKLGMLYHAYQFLDEARRCYRIARELAPEEYRWIYYGAKLEKSAYRYEASEALFLLALDHRPRDAELWAELGELYLLWGRRDDAQEMLGRALELDPLQPVAALGRARLLSLEQRWGEVIDLLTPLLARFPRLSRAHQFLAAAYGALGKEKERALHQEAGEYGSAVESDLMRELNDLAVGAILEGDPTRGQELLQSKCARCHDHERIYDHDEDRAWWGRTIRRMQREAGWNWLSDDEAAAIAAYLSER